MASGGVKRAIEVDALDERVDASGPRARLRSGSTTAASSPMPTSEPVGRRRQLLLDARDELALR